MSAYKSQDLLVRPESPLANDLIVEVTPESVGWQFIGFQVRRLAGGATWQFSFEDSELAIVCLSGLLTIETNRGRWEKIGGRANVFEGIGHVVYLPRNSFGKVSTEVGAEFAVACVPTDQDHAAFHLSPNCIKTSIRGGDNATRQINYLLPPGSPVHRLVLVEVYTPSGSWSSYPPHKHDVHRVDHSGNIVEADLEEIYYYRFDRPEGYALQQIYTDSSSPLHQAGNPIDAVIKARDHDVVIVPEGYHPVCCPPGYSTYYLNVLAGSAQSLACTDDPHYAWVKQNYQSVDARLPMYSLPSTPKLEL